MSYTESNDICSVGSFLLPQAAYHVRSFLKFAFPSIGVGQVNTALSSTHLHSCVPKQMRVFYFGSPCIAFRGNPEANPGAVQGVQTPALLIRVPFLKKTVSTISPEMHKNSPFSYMKYKNFLGRGHDPPRPYSLGAFSASLPVPLSDELDTRP